MTPTRSIGSLHIVLFAAGLALGVGGTALALRARHRVEAHETPAALPRTPADYMPVGAHGVAWIDVERLRHAPALASWFGGEARADEPCELSMLRRVHSVAIAVGGGLDQVGVAFAGNLPQADLIACARSRLPSDSTIEHSHYRGIELMRLAPRTRPELLPSSSGSEIVYLPGGVVLAGSYEMVRRMIDRGLSPSGSDEPSATSELRRRLGNGFDAIATFEVPADSAARTGNELLGPEFAHVRGIALGLRGGDTLDVNALFACDDFDSPRTVSDALTQMKQSLATSLRLPSLAEPFERARVERRATDVRVEASLTGAELDALTLMVRSLLSQPPPSLPSGASSAPP